MDRMLEVMEWEQLQAWQQYAAIEPFGEWRADLRMGILAAQITNVVVALAGKRGTAKPADFMPKFDRPPAPDPDEIQPMSAEAWGRAKEVLRAIGAVQV